MSQKRSQPCHPFYLGQKRMSNSCRGSQYHPDRNRPVWRKGRIRDNSVEKQTEHVRQQYISLDRPLCYTCSHHQRVGNFHPLQVPELGHTIQTLLHLFCRRRAAGTPLLLALPQAIEKNFYAGFTALLGFLFMFFSNGLIKKITKTEVLAFGIVAAEGIAIYGVSDRIGSQIS